MVTPERPYDQGEVSGWLAQLMHELGHRPRGLEANSRDRWRYVCECGYVSTYRNSQRDAIGAGLHHGRLIYREWKANGGVTPDFLRRAATRNAS